MLAIVLAASTAAAQEAPQPQEPATRVRQSPPPRARSAQEPREPQTPSAPSISFTVGGTPFAVGVSERDRELRKAMEALRDAEAGESRDEAMKQVRDILSKQYDEAMDGYEKYLDDLTKRVAELREQISKRRAARDELVELRLKMMVSEADGLGWPDARNAPASGLPSVPGFWGGGSGFGSGAVSPSSSPSPSVVSPARTREAPPTPDTPDRAR